MSILKKILNKFGRQPEPANDEQLRLAITAMASLPQWPEFVSAFVARREQWLEDTKGPQVYQNHSELVSVTARAAENDHWITLFESAAKRATEPDSQ